MAKTAIVIGAGPAGLTAAYELLKQSDEYEVTVLEESGDIGGISKTVNYKGNRMDMGGHRFFSKIPEVNAWWESLLPMQGAPSYDDILLGRDVTLSDNGPDPEREDRVMLTRGRVSRIYFDKKFFDYPISLKWETFMNMGLKNDIVVVFSYLKSVVFKREERSLEDFYINRFGKKLYSMFFEHYTENLWGRHPREIDASWGAQRVKGLSVVAIIRDMLSKLFPNKKNRRVETSLIEEFKYPKLGPGQLWETAACEILKMGGRILKNSRVVRIHKNEHDAVTGVTYESDGVEHTLECDVLLSSMPIKDLVEGMNDVPEKEREIASGLPYRDYITLGVLVKRLALTNKTKRKTVSGIIPDNWVYVHDRSVTMGRFQIYNNWSPYMVKDLENTVWIGLEYFVTEGDEYWNMSEDGFAELAKREMVAIGLIESADDVIDYHRERVKKAYPAYFDSYSEMDKLVKYLSGIKNLYCIGRNGQHRYNNLDHSMCTSFEAVRCILSGSDDKSGIWSVNTEKEYHEAKTKG
ncbi:MAG: NAD(P)/FAD-dependent oxidoreductase [Clostridia bacterium]|nr:NAD(P)/FAD-dependent oxidoreductase [Clostridia bacterium]